MKMTLVDVMNKQRSLTELANSKLPYKLSYAIAKNLKALQAEVETIEKGRLALIEEFAEKDEEGNPIIENGQYKLGEKLAMFNREFQNFMSMETEIDIFTVSEAAIEYDDPARFDALTAAQILAIDFMIEQ